MPKRSPQARAELRTRAVEALKARASAASQARIDASFDDLCVELVSEWIVADPRPESATQQAEYWIGRVYEELIPDEQPAPTGMYTRFSLSLARAQYVARLLRTRLAAAWRAAATDELLRCLGSVGAKAKEAAAARQAKTQRFECSVSRVAYDELVVLYEATAVPGAEGQRPAPPRKMTSSPGITWFSITAETALLLLDCLRQGRQGGTP